MDAELKTFEDALDAVNSMTAVWVRPVLKAMGDLGGEASPIEVEQWLYHYYSNKLRPQQWAHVIKNKYVRWARNELRKLGALGGETGHWALTALGERYCRRHQDEPLAVPTDWPSLSDEETGAFDVPAETVEATSPEGYEIPLLRRLAHGAQSKREMIKAIGEDLKHQLLPGDLRLVPQGVTAFEQRVAWAVTHLGRKGEASNVGHGSWEITDAGRARLAREGKTWSLNTFRGSRTKVRGQTDPSRPSDTPNPEISHAPTERWSMREWEKCRDRLRAPIYDAINDRIRPDLGPSPASPLARNIILYGPPGTGKTHTARLLANALISQRERVEKERYRLIQFHPSYSYEDFVQGLRPDLTGASIGYRMQPGPFAQICLAASGDQDHFYVLVIDEINRGEPSRIFGEALLGLEYRGTPISMLGGGELVVPPNLVVIGTMNSVDRSVALMDYALRRRFGFVYLAPDLGRVREKWAGAPKMDEIIGVVEKLNEWLQRRLGTEHVLGHSFFMNASYPLDIPSNLHKVWRLDVEPLLEEYLFHDREKLDEIRKNWAQWTQDLQIGKP